MLSFDLGEGEYTHHVENIVMENFPGKFKLILGDSKVTLPEYISSHSGPMFDLIYIDGGHDYHTASSDLRNCRELAHEKTILVFDDVLSDVSKASGFTLGPTKTWSEAKESKYVEEFEQLDVTDRYGIAYGQYL